MKVAVTPQFKTRVDVEILTMTGTPEKQSFNAVFKGMDRAEYKALMDSAEEASKAGQDGDALIASKVLLGWEGVEDEQGVAMPFTPENVATVWNKMPGARLATVRTFILAITGARTGN